MKVAEKDIVVHGMLEDEYAPNPKQPAVLRHIF